MKPYLFLLIPLLLLSACRRQEPAETLRFGAEPYDSAALHLALVPNRDCLPVYYAKRAGLFDSVGVKVQIATCPSQLDCDTTLLGPSADGGWADAVRRTAYGKRAARWQTMWQGTDRWQLYVCGDLRVKTVRDLAGRTMAQARQTAESQWLDRLIQSEKLSADEVYRPQIHHLRLRAQMLTGDQTDAAMLCWPYTALARSEGNRAVGVQGERPLTGCFVMKSDRLRTPSARDKWQRFERARRMALDSIRLKGPAATSLILRHDYGLPAALADTLRFPSAATEKK